MCTAEHIVKFMQHGLEHVNYNYDHKSAEHVHTMIMRLRRRKRDAVVVIKQYFFISLSMQFLLEVKETPEEWKGTIVDWKHLKQF